MWKNKYQDLDLDDLDDLRKDENWKIQKRKGFLKDRESKAKMVKQSKTMKRNSKEPKFNLDENIKAKQSPEVGNTFDFLDQIMDIDSPAGFNVAILQIPLPVLQVLETS